MLEPPPSSPESGVPREPENVLTSVAEVSRRLGPKSFTNRLPVEFRFEDSTFRTRVGGCFLLSKVDVEMVSTPSISIGINEVSVWSLVFEPQ